MPNALDVPQDEPADFVALDGWELVTEPLVAHVISGLTKADDPGTRYSAKWFSVAWKRTGAPVTADDAGHVAPQDVGTISWRLGAVLVGSVKTTGSFGAFEVAPAGDVSTMRLVALAPRATLDTGDLMSMSGTFLGTRDEPGPPVA